MTTRPATLLPLLLLAACAPSRVPPPAPEPAPPEPVEVLVSARPEAVGMHPRLSTMLDSVAEAAIGDSVASAVAIAVGRYGRLLHLRGYGRTSWAADAPAVTDSTLFDLASLTKVVATTTLAMMEEERGRLDLGRPVHDYLPELADSAKAGITVRMLLTHSGGLEAFAPLFREIRGRAAYLRAIDERPLAYEPGTATRYSDWDLVLLGMVLERIGGEPLDRLAERRLFRPLGMRDAGFRPDPSLLGRVVATEVAEDRGGLIHGEVHDPNAWALGGVAGHAGLFASARDLAVFAQMMLNGGSYGPFFAASPATVARWTAPQRPGSSRALGWDTPAGESSAGRFSSARSFGHTGYTGTSLWVDPERGLFVVLLTNRVHPTSAETRHAELRRAVADLVQQAVLDAPAVPWEARRGGG